MLVKCSNPSCPGRFLHLNEGTLFRLERDVAHCSFQASEVEYFWLCDHCSSAMTLCLKEDGTVIAAPLPNPVLTLPDGVVLSTVVRERGLLLRKVHSPERPGDLSRPRLNGRHHAK